MFNGYNHGSDWYQLKEAVHVVEVKVVFVGSGLEQSFDVKL